MSAVAPMASHADREPDRIVYGTATATRPMRTVRRSHAGSMSPAIAHAGHSTNGGTATEPNGLPSLGSRIGGRPGRADQDPVDATLEQHEEAGNGQHERRDADDQSDPRRSMTDGEQRDRQHRREADDRGHRTQAHAGVHGRCRGEREGREQPEQWDVDGSARHRQPARAETDDGRHDPDAGEMEGELEARVPQRGVAAEVREDGKAEADGQPLDPRTSADPADRIRPGRGRVIGPRDARARARASSSARA